MFHDRFSGAMFNNNQNNFIQNNGSRVVISSQNQFQGQQYNAVLPNTQFVVVSDPNANTAPHLVMNQANMQVQQMHLPNSRNLVGPQNPNMHMAYHVSDASYIPRQNNVILVSAPQPYSIPGTSVNDNRIEFVQCQPPTQAVFSHGANANVQMCTLSARPYINESTNNRTVISSIPMNNNYSSGNSLQGAQMPVPRQVQARAFSIPHGAFVSNPSVSITQHTNYNMPRREVNAAIINTGEISVQKPQAQHSGSNNERSSCAPSISSESSGKRKSEGVAIEGGNKLEKPKRPLSAYNLFFRHERAHILGIPLEDQPHNKFVSAKKRRHVRVHGKISFSDLGKLIGQRWKNLESEQAQYYKDLAANEKKDYERRMDEYRRNHLELKNT